MGQQNWPSYKQIDICLSDANQGYAYKTGLCSISSASDLAPLHTLYNVSKLASPLLQEIYYFVGTCDKAVYITFTALY